MNLEPFCTAQAMWLRRIILSLIFGFPFSAAAKVYDVATTSELREALSTAAEAGGHNTVRLAAGTYSTQDDGLGTFEFVSARQGSMTITSVGTGNAILHGGGIDKVLLLAFPDEKPLNALTLDNFIISDSPASVDAGLDIGNIESTVLSGMVFENHGNNAIMLRSPEAATVEITDSTFESNGTGIAAEYSTASISVADSVFVNNKVGVFFARNSDSSVQGSVFEGNNGSRFHGIVHQAASVERNVSRDNEGIVVGYSSYPNPRRMTVSGNTFTGNTCVPGEVTECFIKANKADITNNIFLNTREFQDPARPLITATCREGHDSFFSNNLFLDTKISNGVCGDARFANNIFLGDSAITASSSSTIALYNNYIDESRLESALFYDGSENIFGEVKLGFVNLEGGDFRLTFSSDFIDKGTTNIELAYIPAHDHSGVVARVIGASIDIGPYEYDSDSPPDSDYDGVPDTNDAFPSDPSEFLDTDGDGIGNNADPDDDGDGIWDIDDHLPLEPNTPPPSLAAFLNVFSTIEGFLRVNTENTRSQEPAEKPADEHIEEPESIPTLPMLGFFILCGLLGLFGVRRLAH